MTLTHPNEWVIALFSLGVQKEERGYTGGVAPFGIKPDDDLLSHGEAPHYHRR